MSREYCDRCGQEVETDGSFDCDEGLCPFSVLANNGQPLDFSRDIGSSTYVPEYIPEYDITIKDKDVEE